MNVVVTPLQKQKTYWVQKLLDTETLYNHVGLICFKMDFEEEKYPGFLSPNDFSKKIDEINAFLRKENRTDLLDEKRILIGNQKKIFDAIFQIYGIASFPKPHYIKDDCIEQKCTQNNNLEDPITMDKLEGDIVITDSGYCFNRDSIKSEWRYRPGKDPMTRQRTNIRKIKERNPGEPCQVVPDTSEDIVEGFSDLFIFN